MAVFDTLSEFVRAGISKLALGVRRRLGIPVRIKIFIYEVRVSGEVFPPKKVIKKRPSPETIITFEVEFPDFRSTLETERSLERRFRRNWERIVDAQEVVAVDKRAFSWGVWQPIKDIKPLLSEEELKRIEVRKAKEKRIFLKPNFAVTDVVITPVTTLEIEEDRIPKRQAEDYFLFKVYRPDENIPYIDWDGRWLHDLE